MSGNERLFRIEVPNSVRESVVELVESGEFPEWMYPKVLDESLAEYVDNRQGQFDEVGFEVFPEERLASVHRSDVETPPSALVDVIEEERRSVFRESYTLRFEFIDESWSEVEDVWVEAYWVITEPTDL